VLTEVSQQVNLFGRMLAGERGSGSSDRAIAGRIREWLGGLL